MDHTALKRAWAKPFFRSMSIPAAIMLLVGCGQPHIYDVTEWQYASWIDSATIGVVAVHHVETYPNTSGIGETYPDLSSWYLSVWTCSADGHDLKQLRTLDSTDSRIRWGVPFFVLPRLVIFYRDHRLEYDFGSGEVQIIEHTAEAHACTWNGQYCFTDNPMTWGYTAVRTDSNVIFDAKTGQPVMTVYRKRPLNLDRSGKNMLLVTDSTLEYLSMEDHSIRVLPARTFVVVNDYRFGRVALALVDSTTQYTMVPEFDTLPAAVARALWTSRASGRAVYNLRNGDYVENNGTDIIRGNIVEETSTVVVPERRIRVQ